jgi:hypothetical protein
MPQMVDISMEVGGPGEIRQVTLLPEFFLMGNGSFS